MFTQSERFNTNIENLHRIFGEAIDRIADLEQQLEKANVRIQVLQKFNAQLLSKETPPLRSPAVEAFIAAVEEIVANADRNRTLGANPKQEESIQGDLGKTKAYIEGLTGSSLGGEAGKGPAIEREAGLLGGADSKRVLGFKAPASPDYVAAIRAGRIACGWPPDDIPF